MSTLSIVRHVRSLLSDTDESSFWKEDWEINDAITIAVPEVEIEYPQGFTVTVSGEDSITPTPDEPSKVLFSYKAAIIIREGSESQSTRDTIFVKDGDTTIDTTKGASSRGKSLTSLKSDYQRLIDRLTINDLDGVKGFRINTYDYTIL